MVRSLSMTEAGKEGILVKRRWVSFDHVDLER